MPFTFTTALWTEVIHRPLGTAPLLGAYGKKQFFPAPCAKTFLHWSTGKQFCYSFISSIHCGESQDWRIPSSPCETRQHTDNCVSKNSEDLSTQGSKDWRNLEICSQHIDWAKAVQIGIEQTASGRNLSLPEGIKILVVYDLKSLPGALQELRASMKDPIIGIDLEWKPDFVKGKISPVALIQLASSSVAVLIRTAKLTKLPPALLSFLQDEKVAIVGFDWNSADKEKFQRTFGSSKEDFGRFIDLQKLGRKFGYHRWGIRSLTKQFLNVEIRKSRRVSMSNWEVVPLKNIQILYAALDAFMTGEVFRALHRVHAKSSLES